MNETLNACINKPLSRPAQIFNGIIVLLILVSIAAIPIHLIPSLEWLHPYLDRFDKIVVTIFTAEYALRIYIAKNPFKYIFSLGGIIDLLAILPFFLAQANIIKEPALFLLLRTLRIFKMANIYALEREEVCRTTTTSHGRFRAQPGERIERIVQHHGITFVFRIVAPMVMLIGGITIGALLLNINVWLGMIVMLCFVIFSLIVLYKIWLDFNYDVLYVTNKRLMFQRRDLFGFFTNETTFESITNIRPDNTGLIRNIFKYGDIHIDTASQHGTLSFLASYRPHLAVEHISKNRQQAIDRLRERGSMSLDQGQAE